jgi:diguanylate cyclase (GGDEF)-like protein
VDAPALELAQAASLADLIGSTTSARASTDALPGPLARLAPGARCWLALPLTSRTQRPALLVVCSTARAGYDEAQAKIGSALVGQGMLAYDSALLSRQVERLASLDGLSGLNNRRRFLQLAADQATLAPTQSRPMGVAMVDIDHFKEVNDTFGHAVGDEVIRVVATRIQENLRSDDIFGRYGGEEFAIVLPEVGIGVGLITERLREAVAAAPITTAAGPIIVTVSIGTAMQENPDEELDDLLDRADGALDQAKQCGRNRVAHG